VGAAEVGGPVSVGTSVGAEVTGVHDMPIVKHIKSDGYSRGTLAVTSNHRAWNGVRVGAALICSIYASH
jgi:hypothetical protein